MMPKPNQNKRSVHVNNNDYNARYSEKKPTPVFGYIPLILFLKL